MDKKEKITLFFKKTWTFIVKNNIGTTLAWIFIISINMFYIHSILQDNSISETEETFSTKENIADNCNVLSVKVSGGITSYGMDGGGILSNFEGDVVYSDDIKRQIDAGKDDDDIKAVLLEINSYGGDVGGAQEIVYALKNLNKPVIAVIKSAGVSAGYWIASTADKIYAYETADVGGIGVTMSYLDETALNAKEGKFFVPLSIGKFKDAGNPDKVLTAEEKTLMMRDITEVYNIFINQVSLGRKIPLEKVRALADGSSMLAERAKNNGLIDEIGSTYDAINYLGEVIGEEVELCVMSDE